MKRTRKELRCNYILNLLVPRGNDPQCSEANLWKTKLTVALGANDSVLSYHESSHFSVYLKPHSNSLPCKFEIDCN